MTLRQMEYLLAVVEEGSFTRAAQRLAVSQPTLSHQVKALERSVGGPLLERLPDRVLLTPTGREYLPHAATAVRSAAKAYQAGRGESEAEPPGLRVATVYSIALSVLPAAVRAWRRDHPHGQVEVLEFGGAEEMAAQTAWGAADVAVGPRPRGWTGPVRELGGEDLVVVVSRDDPLARRGRRTVELEALADREWVLYTDDLALAPVVARACAVAGFTPRAAVHTHHPVTAVQLAAAGLGPALVPKSIIGPGFGGVLLAPRPRVGRELVAFTAGRAPAHVLAFVDVLAATRA